MSRHNDSLAVLALSPSNAASDHRPIERRIDRSTLLDVAPDRESLLMSNKAIEELRRILKIQVGRSTEHWLYCRHRKQPSSSARASTLVEGTTDSGLCHDVRRESSTSSVLPPSKSSAIQSDCLVVQDNNTLLDPWGIPLTDALISPRPLGQTHTLVIHEASAAWTPANRAIIAPRRTKNQAIGGPKFTELPINDLLFLLNVPNLSSRKPALPRRLDNELPRVVMQVPHLETFPELVIYLHTMNQAELFRALIPEWIRDLMHPLPSPAVDSGDTTERRARMCEPMRLFARLVFRFKSKRPYHEIPQHKRTINSISKDIANASGLSVGGDDIDPVLHAASLMDALRDNLDYIGYYGEELWSELDNCRAILIRALSWKAKIDEK